MKKGFTLVEMLAVLVVLSIVMTVAIRSINSIKQSQMKKINEEKVNNIEKAAVLYGQDNPEVFNTHNCNNYNETGEGGKTKLLGIGDYQNYSDCVVISASILAGGHYLDVDYENDTPIIKNNITGYNMLNYNIVLYRYNNRVNAYVSVDESSTITYTGTRVLAQTKAPQGGVYSNCPSDHPEKVLVGEEYKCGLAYDAVKSVLNSETYEVECTVSNSHPVLGYEEYCCPENTVYIEGLCVSKVSTSGYPTCPTNYEISANKNMCTYKSTLAESTCASGYTKMQSGGRYLCVKNSDNTIKIAPSCPSGKILIDDQNYCDVGESYITASTCSTNYEKRFINNVYKCILKSNSSNQKDPTCPSGKHLIYHNMYCSTSTE